MSNNPFFNAISATAYISLISVFMFYLPKFAGPVDTVLAPVVALSLFTFSAALMGYLFLYTPIALYFEGKRTEAISLFLKTVGVFGVLTLIAIGGLLLWQ